MFKKIVVCVAVCIILISASFFTGAITTKHRLMEQHRQQLELIRSRTEQYESIYRQARETNRELGECLSKSAATLSGLRLQISEVRRRYEKMEELLSGVRWDDSDVCNDNGCISSSTGEKIE